VWHPYRIVGYRYWGRTGITEESDTGIDFVPNVPKWLVPVLRSYRTIPECSVGYWGRTEPYRRLWEGIYRAYIPGILWNVPYRTQPWIVRLKSTPGWCAQQCCSCCMCVEPCRVKLLAGVHSAAVAVCGLHRYGIERFVLAFSPLPPSPLDPPLLRFAARCCRVAFVDGVGWKASCLMRAAYIN